jgi:hypothetical protein
LCRRRGLLHSAVCLLRCEIRDGHRTPEPSSSPGKLLLQSDRLHSQSRQKVNHLSKPTLRALNFSMPAG